MGKALSRIGTIIVRAYVCHILVFTIGAICGAVVAFSVSQAVFVGLLKSRGLL